MNNVYDTCKILPLKIFFEIAENGNVELLLIEDEQKDKAYLIKTWENLVEEYVELDGNQQIRDVIEKGDEIYTQAALYCEIKGMLLYLFGAESKEYVDRLNELGYKIDVSDHKKKIETIRNNDRRANHISTRIQIIQKEIDGYSNDGKKASFDSVMAWLSSELGFEPKEDLTVLRYLEYKKTIYERNKAKRSYNRRSSTMA
jgi:uncharacterized protein with ParB-like and HNH nuclease domain